MTMEQALYRKYRPKSFKDTVGQDHITKTLQNAIKQGRISHAYLFTGPHGVGKTSVARILAHEVNGLPYEADSVHLDIIEIDAASNRRIDEIRDLRDRVRIAPAAAKYKVYIIDEVHMLTREAFNALLKTLEEPPAHCIFILATTEAHKLPETIISRTQRHEFKPVNRVQMAGHLGDIAKKESIDISPEALDMLADFGEGSFRDSIGYLEQLGSASKKITADDVRQTLGLPSSEDTARLLAAVRQGSTRDVSQLLINAQEQGTGAAELAAAIAKQIRQDIIEGRAAAGSTKLLKELIEVRASGRPAEYLEIALLEAASQIEDSNPPPAASQPKATLPKTEIKAAHISTPSLEQKTPQVAESKPQAQQKAGDFSLELWPQVISQARDQAASIYTALCLATPSFNDGLLKLAFEFPLHQKKLEQPKNKAMITDIISSLCGNKPLIECVVDKAAKRTPKAEPQSAEPQSIKSITDIFGTAEMVEA